MSMQNKKKISLADNMILFSLISIVLGLIVGAVALIIAGFNPIDAYSAMIEGIIGKPKYIAWTIIRSTPLILTGLSVAFAFKTGLFNIVAITSFIPNLDFNHPANPPHAAPLKPATNNTSGTCIIAGSSTPAPTIVATKAPTIN